MNRQLIEDAVSQDNREYWEAVKVNKLKFQKCGSCQRFYSPASIMCPHCGSYDVVWSEVSGKGIVYSWVVFHKAYRPEFKDRVPYNVAIVELDEGVRMLTSVVNCELNQIHAGMAVRVVFQGVEEEQFIPVFEPVQ